MTLRGANVVCFGSIDWSFNWHIPQEVASALARGNRVLYVENTGVRRPSVKDLPRLRLRLRNWLRKTGRDGAASAGVDVHSPLLVPLPYSRVAGVFNAMMLLRVVRRWLRRNPDAPLVFFTFLPTPLARGLIAALEPALVVYCCIDRFTESSPDARRVVHSERKLLAEAGLVLVTSQVLYRLAAEMSSRVSMVASGVHVDDFEGARRSRTETHSAFGGLSGPIVGYVGSLRSSMRPACGRNVPGSSA
jgi:hypothetical protein